MAFKIEVTEPAEKDLFDTFALIREVAPHAAKVWIERFYSAIQTLSSMPDRCPIAPEADEVGKEIRHLIFGRKSSCFRIIFDISQSNSTVRILRVWRSSRDRIKETDLDE